MTTPTIINNYITNNNYYTYNINIFRFEDFTNSIESIQDCDTSEDVEVEYVRPIIKKPNKLKKLFKKIKSFFK